MIHNKNMIHKIRMEKNREDVDYCMRIWKEWRNYRHEPFDITNLMKTILNEVLFRLFLEIKKNGEQYPLNTVHHTCCGIKGDC